MKGNSHASCEVSEEAAHSVCLDVALACGVEVVESSLQILVNIVVSSLSGQAEVSLQDLSGGCVGILDFENELTGLLALSGGHLSCVLAEHGPHELVTSGSLDVELSWELSRVSSEVLTAFVVIPSSWETWVRVVLVPLGCNTTVVRAKLNS